jgi:hypothetical protein
MLTPIKTFYVEGAPSYEEIVEARDTAQREYCVVELRWLPDIFAGWYHEYVFNDSDPQEIYDNLPRVYGL